MLFLFSFAHGKVEALLFFVLRVARAGVFVRYRSFDGVRGGAEHCLHIRTMDEYIYIIRPNTLAYYNDRFNQCIKFIGD